MKKGTQVIFLIIVLIIIGGGVYFYTKSTDYKVSNNSGKEIKLPIFSDYPVEALTTSSIPQINLASHPKGSQFKTIISEANNTAPNFAGKYSIVTWGCGTSCQIGVIIDRKTGTIISDLPFVMEYGYEAKIDSSLIVINPYTSDLEKTQESYPVTTYYVTWNGKNFEPVGSYIITKDSIKFSTSTAPMKL